MRVGTMSYVGIVTYPIRACQVIYPPYNIKSKYVNLTDFISTCYNDN